MSAQDALRAAAAEIGYYAPNDPEPGSKYGRWAAQQLNQAWLRGPSTSIWWCMLFASWAVYTTGGTLPGGISFNTNTTLAAARRAGATVPVSAARPGDLVIFDWDGNGNTDHVGLVEVNHGSYLQTIEGNTSGSSGGSQSAGNGVWRRTRSLDVVAGIVRPSYPGAAPSVPAAATAGLAVDGYWGADTTRRLQQVLGTTVDGVVSSQDVSWRAQNPSLTGGWEWVASSSARGSQLIKALQRTLGVTVDGLIGPATIRALQQRMGTPVDGHLDGGSSCVMALQRRLNTGAI